MADIEGDDADRIAGDQVAVVRFVVESESEDPAQLFHASHAVFAVEGEDDLAVASGLEFVFVFQLSAEFAMVIYLAVDGEDQFAVFVRRVIFQIIVINLCLVFAVVIFFWMAFHQNGLTLTYFADEFVQPTAEGAQSMVFDVINLFMVIVIVYAGFAFFGAKTGKAKGISALVMLAALAVIVYKYSVVEGSVSVSAPIFQQFNPFYVVALTPVSMAIFGALARKGKEPTAPRKIAYGMLIAGCGFLVMLLASMGLNSPDVQKAAAEGAKTFASPNWLIGTYLVLTFGELLLSPMGISFVSKVAPPKYKGAMMGGWFVATALGNLLVSVGGFLWGDLPLTVVWSVFIVLCILSAIFMFAVMGKLEKVAK